ncbi:MAG: peptide chain release factor 2 [bacterium]
MPPSPRRGGHFDLDSIAAKILTLEAAMSAADFWSDAERAKKVSREAAELKREHGEWDALKKDVLESSELAEMAEHEKDSGTFDELESSFAELEKRYKKLEFSMLFSGAHDSSNAMLAVHAGSGGDEAQDWAAMLARMYTRYAEARGWKVEIISESLGEAGIKSIMFKIEGRYSYGYLKSEAGTHRLVRISPFDAEKLRHTTFALVEVLPEIDEVADFDVDPKDLRIDTFMSGGKGGQSVNTTYSAVRIVHIPTGITVNCQNERSQAQNKENALKILKAKLFKLKEEELEREKKSLRGEFKSAEWGSQIRSYVLHPYKLVKDHRTGYETSEAEKVLEGDLDSFMEAYLRSQVEASRAP